MEFIPFLLPIARTSRATQMVSHAELPRAWPMALSRPWKVVSKSSEPRPKTQARCSRASSWIKRSWGPNWAKELKFQLFFIFSSLFPCILSLFCLASFSQLPEVLTLRAIKSRCRSRMSPRKHPGFFWAKFNLLFA